MRLSQFAFLALLYPLRWEPVFGTESRRHWTSLNRPLNCSAGKVVFVTRHLSASVRKSTGDLACDWSALFVPSWDWWDSVYGQWYLSSAWLQRDIYQCLCRKMRRECVWMAEKEKTDGKEREEDNMRGWERNVEIKWQWEQKERSQTNTKVKNKDLWWR